MPASPADDGIGSVKFIEGALHGPEALEARNMSENIANGRENEKAKKRLTAIDPGIINDK